MARPYRVLKARPAPGRLADAAITVAALAGSLAFMFHDLGRRVGSPATGGWGLGEASLVLVVVATAPLMAWRRAPLGIFALTGSACVLLAVLGYAFVPPLGLTAALYLVAASRSSTKPWTWRTTVTVLGFLTAYLGAVAAAQAAGWAAGTRLSDAGSDVLRTGLAWAVAWFAGERTRLRREQVAEWQERATRAEHDAERERRLAVAEERARIARDLHDSAGHAVNVIVVRAGAARLWHDQDPDRALTALEAIEDIARQTAADIDQFVGALRDHGPGNGEVAAPAGLASLDSLIVHYAETGLNVTVDTVGVRRPLGAAADHGAYRILQEALTNAVRHGTGTAQIELAFGGTDLELTVTNPTTATGSPHPGGGHGLIGMRERVNLLGGDLDAGCANGVFQVRARIPCEGLPA